jgi:hypothetical protein
MMEANSRTEPVPVAIVTDHEPRCWRCHRRLGAYFTRPWELKCQKCNALNASAPTVIDTFARAHA